MKLAVFSDIHDNPEGFAKTLQDAERCNADQYISLGDVGRNPLLFEMLRNKEIPCVYGNWESAGWSRLPNGIASWVGSWPTSIQIASLMPDDGSNFGGESETHSILFTHATPAMPPLATTTQEMSELLHSGVTWTHVFPRLHNNEQAVWDAFAVMEEDDIRATFHGHTHVQMAWLWTAADVGEKRKLRAINGPTEFRLEPGASEEANRYLIGVGSCGEPHDGDQLRYALLDTVTHEVELRAI